MTRLDAMRRHPAGRGRVVWLVSAARRQQAQDVADRLLVDVEAFGPAVVPESAEVAEERMNREACELGSLNAPPRPAPVHPVVGVVQAICAGLILYGLICLMGIVGAMFGGWPL